MKNLSFARRAALSLALIGGLSLSAAAGAQQASRAPGWETGLDIIYQASTDIDYNGGSKVKLDDDFGFSIMFGYRFNEKLELQFGFDWQYIDYDITVQSAPPSLPARTFRGSSSLESFTPRVSANYNFMPGPITPYVTAGIGWSFIDTNIPSGRAQNVCWWDPWWGYVCGAVQDTRTVDAFEYQLGVGLRWDIGPAYTLRFGYEKHWLDLSKPSSTPDVDQYKVGFAYRY